MRNIFRSKKPQISFHLVSNCLTALFLFVLLFFQSSALADWPTEPYESIQLTTIDEWDRVDSIIDDGEGGIYFIIQVPLYFGIEQYYSEFILQGLDIEGNLRWPEMGEPEDDKYIYYFGAEVDRMIMATDGNGVVWVAWEDFHDANIWEDPPFVRVYVDSEVRMQRIGPDRTGEWGLGGLLVQDQRNDEIFYENHQYPLHIEPQDDGSVILLWRNFDCWDLEGNIWAQRFDEDGNPMWGENVPTIPFIEQLSPYASFKSDLNGGVLFIHNNNILHLNNDGELEWEYDEIVFPYGLQGMSYITHGYNESTYILVAGGPIGSRLLGFDLNSLEFYGENYFINYWNADNNFNRCGSTSYCVTVYDGELGEGLLFLDQDLNPILPDTVQIINPPGIFERPTFINPSGLIGHGSGYHEDHLRTDILAWDTTGTLLWSTRIDTDLTNVYDLKYYLDDLGNTWVLWTNNNPLDIRANIIGPDGQWGNPNLTAIQEHNPDNNPQNYNIEIIAWPNPFNSSINIRFENAYRDNCNISIYDICGRQISDLKAAEYLDNTKTVSWNSKGFASGVYFVKMEAAGRAITKKIVLIR